MAIINQRGKSSRRNKKLPYPGHRDLPGSSPRCPAAFPPPSRLPGQGPDLVPSSQASAFHLPKDPLGIQQHCSLGILGLGTSYLQVCFLSVAQKSESSVGRMQRGLKMGSAPWTRTLREGGRGEAS